MRLQRQSCISCTIITARTTYGISIISERVTEDTKLSRNALHTISYSSEVAEKTGLSAGFIQQCEDKVLSAGFIQQCEDKVLWSWKSYKALYSDWERKLAYHQEKLLTLDDEKKRARKEQYIQKLLEREPSPPGFPDKTPCRLDPRTGKIQKSRVKLTTYWIHLSTLRKGATIDIPLNLPIITSNNSKSTKWQTSR